jgi:hypothetical protein
VRRVVQNYASFWKRAPRGVRLHLLGGVILLLAAVNLFVIGESLLGTIAAILYALDLGLVWPGLRAGQARADQ